LQACKNAGDTLAERVILVCVWDFVKVDGDTAREVPADLVAGADELDAIETGLVAESSYIPERVPFTKWISRSRSSMPSLAKIR
jgi:hypothetical protein